MHVKNIKGIYITLRKYHTHVPSRTHAHTHTLMVIWGKVTNSTAFIFNFQSTQLLDHFFFFPSGQNKINLNSPNKHSNPPPPHHSPSLIAHPPPSYPRPLNSSWIVPSSQMQWLYNAITAACQTIENDVTSTLGHGGLGLATGACDNLCPAPSPAHPLSASQKIHSVMRLNSLIPWRPLWLGPYICVYFHSHIRLQTFPSLLSFA